jgi:hypothetical protein
MNIIEAVYHEKNLSGEDEPRRETITLAGYANFRAPEGWYINSVSFFENHGVSVHLHQKEAQL